MPDNISLQKVEENDLSIFFDHQRDPVANQMAVFPARDREAFMEHWARIMRNECVILNTILIAKHNLASRRVLENCGFVVSSEGKGGANAHGEKVEEFILKLSE